jgi:hypothetical protein
MADANSTSNASARGIGFAGLLTIVFVILKLNPGGYLDSPVEDWSWWLVFSPLLIAWGIVLLILLVIGLILLGAHLLDKRDLKKRRQSQLKRIQGGSQTMNEIRRRKGLPPL